MAKLIELSKEDKLPIYSIRVSDGTFGRMISSLTKEDLIKLKEYIELALTEVSE